MNWAWLYVGHVQVLLGLTTLPDDNNNHVV